MGAGTKNFGASYIARLVPCPNSEIAACYHPSDLLRTVTQAVGTVVEKSVKSVGKHNGANDLLWDLETVDCGFSVIKLG